MAYIPVEDLYKKTNSMYKLVILASRRAQELNEGSGKLVDVSPTTKISDIALKEILEDRVSYKEAKKVKL